MSPGLIEKTSQHARAFTTSERFTTERRETRLGRCSDQEYRRRRTDCQALQYARPARGFFLCVPPAAAVEGEKGQEHPGPRQEDAVLLHLLARNIEVTILSTNSAALVGEKGPGIKTCAAHVSLQASPGEAGRAQGGLSMGQTDRHRSRLQ